VTQGLSADREQQKKQADDAMFSALRRGVAAGPQDAHARDSIAAAVADKAEARTRDRLQRMTVHGMGEEGFLAALSKVLDEQEKNAEYERTAEAVKAAKGGRQVAGEASKQTLDRAEKPPEAAVHPARVRTLFVRISPEAYGRLISRLSRAEGVRVETVVGKRSEAALKFDLVDAGKAAILLEVTLVSGR
jgi:hypothetical protein